MLFIVFFAVFLLNEAWKSTEKSVIYFGFPRMVDFPKWRRSCRKPHFKEWHMVYERRDIYKYDYWSIISLHQSRVLPVNLRSRPSQMSSFLHHWLETWLCLILANEGTWKKGTSRHKRKAKDRRSEARNHKRGRQFLARLLLVISLQGVSPHKITWKISNNKS